MRQLRKAVRGCMLLLVLVVVVTACVIGVAAALNLGDEPDNIAVEAELSRDSVVVGETFTLTLTIENLDLNDVQINGVGFDTGLLDGVQVQSSEPPFRTSKGRSYPLYGDWREFRLDHTLADGEVLAVTFTLVGAEPGIYTGNLTVWIAGDVLGLFPLDRAWRDGVEFEVR